MVVPHLCSALYSWLCSSRACDTTERLHFHFSLSCIGEGNGNPLQCSCLENPRDGGAWWAATMGSHRVGHDWSDLAAAAEPVMSCFVPGAGVTRINKAKSLPEELTERQEAVCYDPVWSVLWQRNWWESAEEHVWPQWRGDAFWSMFISCWAEKREGKVFQAVCVEARGQGNTKNDERVILVAGEQSTWGAGSKGGRMQFP